MGLSDNKLVYEFYSLFFLASSFNSPEQPKYFQGTHCHVIRELCNPQPAVLPYKVWKFYYLHFIDEYKDTEEPNDTATVTHIVFDLRDIL